MLTSKFFHFFSIAVCCSFIALCVAAQQKCNVHIIFPQELNRNKITIFYGNGLDYKKIAPHFTESRITIADSFYAKYATITIRLDSNNSCGLPLFNSFYVTNKPAIIILNCLSSTHSSAISFDSEEPFVNHEALPKYQLTNAYNFNKLADKYQAYIAEEQNAFNQFNDSLSKADSVRPGTFARNKMLVRNLLNRELSFIRKNPNSYFSFSIFKNYIAPNAFGNPVQLSNFYQTVFPPDFRNTLEGKEVEYTLIGRMIQSSDDFHAPDFKSKDIYGHLVSLDNERGKYVLFNIWATWCAPCVAELPAIRKISKGYPSSELQVISVSCDHDSLAFAKAIKKYKMNWMQIYDDKNLIKLYGGASFVPQLFLINPNGKIIYNRDAYKDGDDANLTKLNAVIQDNLKHF